MKKKGTIVTYLPVGETPGICCSSPIDKKNMLAYLKYIKIMFMTILAGDKELLLLAW